MAHKLKSKVHTFELRPRKGTDGVLTGATTELLMDGVPMKGVTKATVEVAAKGIAKLTVEVFGRFHVVGSFEQVEFKPTEPKK